MQYIIQIIWAKQKVNKHINTHKMQKNLHISNRTEQHNEWAD